jgi:hypothetical protein
MGCEDRVFGAFARVSAKGFDLGAVFCIFVSFLPC